MSKQQVSSAITADDLKFSMNDEGADEYTFSSFLIEIPYRGTGKNLEDMSVGA